MSLYSSFTESINSFCKERQGGWGAVRWSLWLREEMTDKWTRVMAVEGKWTESWDVQDKDLITERLNVGVREWEAAKM